MSYHLTPPNWHLRCDRPGCPAEVASTVRHADERVVRRSAAVAADAAGWQLHRHGDVPLDFCPLHADPAVRHPVTELYRADGTPVDPRAPVAPRKAVTP